MSQAPMPRGQASNIQGFWCDLRGCGAWFKDLGDLWNHVEWHNARRAAWEEEERRRRLAEWRKQEGVA